MTAERPVKLPGRDDCLGILKDAGCSEQVVQHCLAVTGLAVKMARKCGADLRLVEVGALLHDLGRSRTHDITHALEGAGIARKMRLPTEIVRIIERHIGAGITKGEAKRIGLPARSYVPETLEEKIVAHADNLVAGSSRTTLKLVVADLVRAGLEESARRAVALHKELSAACGVDIDDIP